jgi:hypothetical protein
MKVKDKITGKIETVIQTTSNSYLVTQTKLTNKGINCDQWFEEKEFKKRFEEIK